MAAACKTVLVVDDEPDIRNCLVEVLADEGYDVVEAGNGSEALAALRSRASEPPCVIVLDLMMPVMDGYEFRAAQLADVTLAGVPVVIVSADANAKSKAGTLRPAAILTKPLQLGSFVAAVEKQCP